MVVKGLEREILRDRGLEIVRYIRAYRFRKRLWVRGINIYLDRQRERLQIRGLERDILWIMDLNRKGETDYGLGV